MRRSASSVALACALAAGAATAAAQGGGGEPVVPVDPSPGRAVVWAVGDAATPTDGARAVARTIRRGRPDRFLYLGDVYDEGLPSEFRAYYDPLYGALAKITDPTPGNHEWANRRIGYYPYWRAKKGRRQGPWSRTTIATALPHGSRVRKPPSKSSLSSTRARTASTSARLGSSTVQRTRPARCGGAGGTPGPRQVLKPR